MKLDLSKLVLSGNVPVGFRELTAEEFPSPGDIFNASTDGKTEWLTRPAGYGIAGAKYDTLVDRGLRLWVRHFRRIENPPEIPATHGRVTAGTTLIGDLQFMLGSRTVHPGCFAGEDLSRLCLSEIYRLQPAFVVENVTKHCVACYRGITIPPGFRELNEGEQRQRGSDPVWLPSLDCSKPLHVWEFNPEYFGPYGDDCNPTIRRTAPVSNEAPLLPGEKVENATQAIAADIAKECVDPFEYSGYWKRSYEAARADLVRAGEKSEKRRQRLEAQEQEIVTLKATIARQDKTVLERNEAINRIEASCNIRVNNLWQANVDRQAKRNELQYDLDRQSLAVAVLRDKAKLLEVKLKDSEAIAEQRRLRIADLECSLLKIRQEVANTKVNEPAPAQPLAANPFAYREIYDNDRLKNGDEVSYDGIVWTRFSCGPTANITFGELCCRRPGLFRARRKL